MSRSRVDLANAALALLVRGSIRDLDGSRPEAVQTNQHMDTAIEEVIAEFDWPETRVITSLTAVDLSDTRGWSYAYAIPPDCVKIWAVGETRETKPTLYNIGMSEDVSKDTTYIYSDLGSAYIRYGSRRASLGRLNPLVFALMAKKLAMLCCMSLTKSARLYQTLRKEYREDLNHAMVSAANSEPEVVDVEATPELISVRSA